MRGVFLQFFVSYLNEKIRLEVLACSFEIIYKIVKILPATCCKDPKR